MAQGIKIVIRTDAEGWQIETWNLAKRHQAFRVSGKRTDQADFFCQALGRKYRYQIRKRDKAVDFIPAGSEPSNSSDGL